MSKSISKAELPGNTDDNLNNTIAPWQRLTLPRIPLVPDEILRRNSVYFEIDTRFRRAARLLQFLWLKDHGIPTGIHVSGKADEAVTMELGSCLADSDEVARVKRDEAARDSWMMAPAVTE